MFARRPPTARQCRSLVQPLRRRYVTGGTGGQPAEFSARSNSMTSTWIMAGGATVAVGVVYATLMGDPHKATEVATARDPDSVKHMKPKQGTLKRD